MNNPTDIELLARAAVRDPALFRPHWTTGVERDPKLLWLDKNENLDPELAAVTAEVLASVPASALQTYPECAPLYRKLAVRLGVSSDSLLLAHGSDGVIRSVFEAFIEPGDVVLHTAPTFAMYAVYCRMYGANPVCLEYQPSEHGPVLSADSFVGAIGKVRPKLVCLPNPDSPTGTVFAPDELRLIIKAANKAGALILMDEAYYPFYDRSAIDLTAEFPCLIIARTFAKAWGVAGLRIGYAVADPSVAGLLHKVRPMYEVNTLAVGAMERLLDHEDDVRASVRRLNAGKEHFLAEMEELKLRTLRGHGNFLHVAFGDHGPRVHAALKNVVLYRRDFDEPCLKGFSRFSSTTAAKFQVVIDAIRTALGRGSKSTSQ